VSVGGSVLDEENWSRARTTNPTEAAHLKLRLKVRNFGTACASNILPTLTLRIGGINVATFEPGNAQVNLLVPGAVYPPEPGVHWVVDSIDTGSGVRPLALTMEELRALERGAPVSNIAHQSAEQTVNLVYYEKPPQPEEPIINSARVNWKANPPMIYANVTSPQPMFPVKWVRAYHPGLKRGFHEMGEAAEAYKDPHGWEANLDGIDAMLGSDLKIVATSRRASTRRN